MLAIVKQPVYQQLNEALRGLLGSGEFHVGDQFLTERQVSERFEVSRATANKALANLVSEGILEFKKGVGTFVRGGIMNYDLRTLVSFTDKARAAGRVPSTRVLRFFSAPAARVAASVTAALRVRPDATLLFMERLRLADRVPVILERRYVPAARCPGLTRDDLAGSLYELWTRRFGLEIAGAEETIRAVALRPDEAAPLKASRGTAALAVTSVGCLRGNEPLWWERTLYRGDAYEFRNRLGPIRTAQPAVGSFVPAGRAEA